MSIEWGFYGHRQLNRMAIFTLPQEMLPLYKTHIEWITSHAVDPDKRRYAYEAEGPRHFIDLDSWGTYPFSEVPRKWRDNKVKYSKVIVTPYHGEIKSYPSILEMKQDHPKLFDTLYSFMPQVYFETSWELENLGEIGIRKVECQDTFYTEGVVPYQLVVTQHQLTKAFKDRDIDRVLRYSADIGHYVGDAHVPLHTTKNYNGQLTDQVGIHAFWESRIPELFAEEQYDNFVGKATYIEDPVTYYWEIVLSSHLLVDSVLRIEQKLRDEFPEALQFCFDNRLQATTRIQCKEFAAAYQKEMRGMVERRWRATIQSIGSVWFSAWVDAGQPDLTAWKDSGFEGKVDDEDLIQKKYADGNIIGRKHE